MPMFDDPKRELERLEQQLLKEEKWMDEELDSAKRMLGSEPPKAAKQNMDETRVIRPAGQPQVRNYANGYGKKTDPAPTPAAPAEKPLTGLIVLACLETLGIVGVVIYWLFFLL